MTTLPTPKVNIVEQSENTPAEERELRLLLHSRHISEQLLSSLRVNDMKGIFSYARSIQKYHSIPNCHDKDSHIRALRSLLLALYNKKKCEDYKKVLGCITYFSKFEWHNRKTHVIPGDGPWTQFSYNASTITSPNRNNLAPTFTPSAPARTPQTNTTGFNATTPAICLESPSKWTSKTFNVRFTADQLDLLIQSASSPEKATYGLYLYMCSYERVAHAIAKVPNCPISVDYPANIAVYVNAKPVPSTDVFKATSNRQPLSLTEYIIKTTDHPNNISITYSTTARWISSLILTKELTFQAIYSEIRKTGFVTAESVRQTFFKASAGGDDDDDLISTGALVSLKCPLGLCRISTPTRSKYCQHSQCFDCETFLQLNRRAGKWKCPVCSVVVDSWRELIVDGYFEEILQGTSQNDDHVYIEPNGDWKRKEAAKTTDLDVRKTSSRTKGRSLEISLVDDSTASDNDEPFVQGASRSKRRRTEVIDLTLDSDSENDTCNVDSDDLPPLTQEEIDMTDDTNAIPATEKDARSQESAPKCVSNYEKTPACSTLVTDTWSKLNIFISIISPDCYNSTVCCFFDY
ncbi:E3 SUMO-protein ligase pli1 [Coemansia sp. RSA 487]|nr:E3 SUMO-protein ligase pli1 [Coemansia sp. RSA 1843]KAJ2091313.1 E3 SUMO-protein ligase pli1 [Coemansia sp. RSA 986]KAJ2216504.1 E3 SUMO-protein ligase pli1 [Coemansia sp. RSA 487]